MSKYCMTYYKLYTLVDITHTGQYRNEHSKQLLKYKEQNFNTVIQTLGIFSNIWYDSSPLEIVSVGSTLGFPTEEIIKLWRFDWATEKDDLYAAQDDSFGILKQSFNLIPYIRGLGESMEQHYAVFNTGERPNIVFHLK